MAVLAFNDVVHLHILTHFCIFRLVTLNLMTFKTVQLMEATEKLWKGDKYRNTAREAMKKLPNALKAIVTTNGGSMRTFNRAIAHTHTFYHIQCCLMVFVKTPCHMHEHESALKMQLLLEVGWVVYESSPKAFVFHSFQLLPNNFRNHWRASSTAKTHYAPTHTHKNRGLIFIILRVQNVRRLLLRWSWHTKPAENDRRSSPHRFPTCIRNNELQHRVTILVK